MPWIWTLGHQNVRTKFKYDGSVPQGVTIHFENAASVPVSGTFLSTILRHFRGRSIPGGFNMTDPTPNGLGEWVRDHALALGERALNPRHATFIAAILVHEKRIRSTLRGNAIWLHFDLD